MPCSWCAAELYLRLVDCRLCLPQKQKIKILFRTEGEVLRYARIELEQAQKKACDAWLVLCRLDQCESGKALEGICIVRQSAGEGWYGLGLEGESRWFRDFATRVEWEGAGFIERSESKAGSPLKRKKTGGSALPKK